jgi:predicted nucleotidyltransferase component of viral defense system
LGKEILTKNQLKFLELVSREKGLSNTFYLTGGTALAAFYLNHRESEDLDFFSEKEVEPLAIETFLKTNKAKLVFEKFEFQRSFNRNIFILHFSSGFLKAEFTYFPFPVLEKGKSEGKLQIDSLKDIAVNKVFTISQQTRARDFVDIYFIIKKTGWKLLDLLQDARIKFDTHIDLIQFGSQLVQIGELRDWPRMLLRLKSEEVESFFLDEAAKFKKEIIS